jgi:hypothetical protein
MFTMRWAFSLPGGPEALRSLDAALGLTSPGRNGITPKNHGIRFHGAGAGLP